MSAITSKLTRQQELKLCSLLGHAKLSLLFKASMHGFTASAFHQKCDRQGPTVTVAYNNSGYIFGAYISKDYAQTGQNIADDKAFLFSFNDHEADKPPLRVVSTDTNCSFQDVNTGPHYVSLAFLYNNTTVHSKPGTYNFDPVEMHGNDLQLIELEVYRVEGFGSLMEKPWRNIDWHLEKRKALMHEISRWTPSASMAQKARVLLVGAVGAGKSSFFNSVNSVFKGYVNCQANTGIAGTSLTTQFRVYSIKADGKFLPITLCDTMGLEEGVNAGLDIDDFTNILKGHIQDRYQLQNGLLFSHRQVSGIPQLVLLTKVDEACRSVAEDLKHIYQSHYIYKMMQEVSVRLGISLSAMVPVKNYSRELDLDPHTDILLLNAVLQIIRTAEAYFDDCSYQEE
ncbi:hypothetical protein PGIGA_G00207160 [Pangasianodon gigas]|uniref:Uncharacterized protein n=1 Tax=Pangasianodon gigas TaxID=30993 RepID=A0ACC5WFH1_PANGG|nr:hypothetical protein [Pangasianodon gigas]